MAEIDVAEIDVAEIDVAEIDVAEIDVAEIDVASLNQSHAIQSRESRLNRWALSCCSGTNDTLVQVCHINRRQCCSRIYTCGPMLPERHAYAFGLRESRLNLSGWWCDIFATMLRCGMTMLRCGEPPLDPLGPRPRKKPATPEKTVDYGKNREDWIALTIARSNASVKPSTAAVSASS